MNGSDFNTTGLNGSTYDPTYPGATAWFNCSLDAWCNSSGNASLANSTDTDVQTVVVMAVTSVVLAIIILATIIAIGCVTDFKLCNKTANRFPAKTNRAPKTVSVPRRRAVLLRRPRPASSPSPARTPRSRHRPAKPAQSVGANPFPGYTTLARAFNGH
ncbi:unnamed protein product [Plutella xylostella]|uniref:(diamondback moth) hypothetical protein n=1 Tax=Plutella xylostella TaxID=51655 RepID=A0A8S4FBL9_PLUXY|nr:unnamed protein product [Plutella xylostella]